MKKKVALITGITGQDGSYLAELLLKKKYKVHGIIRKSSSFNTKRIDHLYVDPHNKTNFFLHYGDLTDSNSIYNLIYKIKPNEIYNLGAQSHVGVSFENPEYTAEVSGIGTLRVLEAIRFLKIKNMHFIGTEDLGQYIIKALSDKQGIGNGLLLGLCVASIGLAVDHLIQTWANGRKRVLGLP